MGPTLDFQCPVLVAALLQRGSIAVAAELLQTRETPDFATGGMICESLTHCEAVDSIA